MGPGIETDQAEKGTDRNEPGKKDPMVSSLDPRIFPSDPPDPRSISSVFGQISICLVWCRGMDRMGSRSAGGRKSESF